MDIKTKQAQILRELTANKFTGSKVFESWKADPQNTIAVFRSLPWSKPAVVASRLSALKVQDVKEHMQKQALKRMFSQMGEAAYQQQKEKQKLVEVQRARNPIKSSLIKAQQTLPIKKQELNSKCISSDINQEQQQSLINSQLDNSNRRIRKMVDGGIFSRIKNLIKNLKIKTSFICFKIIEKQQKI